ncbi:phospholipid scramblase 2-like [Hippopotamus amphibius kiboko]|uniref:phospholipid scramblase 2-like n=1 Tax=Hippopotamus amphibius kiboko TaxID=575201 RepID=UPI00259352C0|nr:phospholipid scramblase 2-like [Hippopotamus amphibius kiboko]
MVNSGVGRKTRSGEEPTFLERRQGQDRERAASSLLEPHLGGGLTSKSQALQQRRGAAGGKNHLKRPGPLTSACCILTVQDHAKGKAHAQEWGGSGLGGRGRQSLVLASQGGGGVSAALGIEWTPEAEPGLSEQPSWPPPIPARPRPLQCQGVSCLKPPSSPGYNGCPAPQAGNSETQAENHVQDSKPETQAEYPDPQPSYPGTQTEYLILPAGDTGAGLVGIPVQYQPVSLQPSVPARLLWIPELTLSSDCPPGLEHLNQLDQVQVHQQIELTEVIIHIETNNKYEIKNQLGQRIYFAAEDTDCCTRYYCGGFRPFTMRILDLIGREVITLERPLRFNWCCIPCCLQEIEIHAPPGIPIGYVTEIRHPFLPKFRIQNENRKDILRIIGPCCMCSCFGDVDFEINSLDGKNVLGKISKQFTGIVREICTNYSNFGIQFPSDVDVKTKAVVLGACFLIDFMFYENTGCTKLLTLGLW